MLSLRSVGLATFTRLFYLVFFIVLLAWIGKLPSPWFEREQDGVLSFNYHPFAMGVAFLVLMPEALLAYADLEDRQVTSHATAKNVHAAIHGLSTLLLVLGLIAIFVNHGGKGIPPLYSSHSWMGIATTTFMGCQATVGAAVYLLHERLGVGGDTRTALMPWHRFFGAATFVMGTTTCCMGFMEKQGFTKCSPDPTYKYCSEIQLANVLVLLAAVIAVLAMGAVYVRQTKAKEDGQEEIAEDLPDPEEIAALS